MNNAEALAASQAVTDYLRTLQGGGTPVPTPTPTPTPGRPTRSPDGRYPLIYVDGFKFDGSRLVCDPFPFEKTVVVPIRTPAAGSWQVKVFEYGGLSSWRKAAISKVPGEMAAALVKGQAAGGPTLSFVIGPEKAGSAFASAALAPDTPYYLNIRNETMGGSASMTTGCAVSS